MVLDVLILLPAVVILLASFQNNQRKMAGRLLKWFLAFGITLTIFAFNLFGVPTLLMNYAGYASPVFNFIPATYRSAAYAGLYVFFVILVIAFLLYLFFSLLGLIFSRERKKLKNPLYAPVHRWYVGMLVGLCRAVIATYIMILLAQFSQPLTQFDMGGSFIITLTSGFDPFYSRLVTTISGLNVPWIV